MRRNLSRVNCSVTLRYRLARLIASRTHLTPRVKRDRSPDEIQYHTIRPSPSSSLPPTAPSVPGTLIAGVQLCAYWRINGSENGRLAVETDGSVVTRVQCFPISYVHTTWFLPVTDRVLSYLKRVQSGLKLTNTYSMKFRAHRVTHLSTEYLLKSMYMQQG